MKRKKTNDHYTVLSFLIIVLVTISSCDTMLTNDQNDLNFEGVKPTEIIDNLNIQTDILYMVSYEQITFSFSTRMPERISDSSNRYVLKNHERVRETHIIDDNGYVHIITEWLDDNADETIPKNLRKILKIRYLFTDMILSRLFEVNFPTDVFGICQKMVKHCMNTKWIVRL